MIDDGTLEVQISILRINKSNIKLSVYTRSSHCLSDDGIVNSGTQETAVDSIMDNLALRWNS